MTSYAPLNQLPAPLAAQYPPLFPVDKIPMPTSTGGDNSGLSSASQLVPANTGVTRTMFGGRSRRRNKRNLRTRKARRRRHTRSSRRH